MYYDLWATLTPESITKLEKVLSKRYSKTFEYHITLDYGINETEIEAYSNLLNNNYFLTVSELFWDEYIEAIIVDFAKSELKSINKKPHITWSSTGDFHPFYSNYMLHTSNQKQTFKPVEIEVFVGLR